MTWKKVYINFGFVRPFVFWDSSTYGVTGEGTGKIRARNYDGRITKTKKI